MEWTVWIGVIGFAGLFALVAALPFRHRPCDGCTGGTDCPLEGRTGDCAKVRLP